MGLVYISIPGLEWMRGVGTAGGSDKGLANLASLYVANSCERTKFTSS